MKVEAEVKIKILDGEEQGKIDTFTTVGETDTTYTEYGVIERLRLEWRHIHNAPLVVLQESEAKRKTCKYYSNPDYTRCHECNAMQKARKARAKA